MIYLKDLLNLDKLSACHFSEPCSSAFYKILLMDGEGVINVDFVDYKFEGRIALFTSPYQHLSIKGKRNFEIEQLAFHGDFYCIEYHKKEVACNGLLFNNIYKQPFIQLKDDELFRVFEYIRLEMEKKEPFSEPILRSYLQLSLAIASKTKKVDQLVVENPSTAMDKFKALLEEYFLTKRKPLFYAEALSLSPNSFTRQCRKYYGKTPTQLIQERIILEAKKQLHLTYKSIKEVAATLNFEDEHYFSRCFKKQTGVSPTHFREKVGISIVADLSMK